MTFAFDFDGVLAKYDGWKGHHHMGEPIEGMRELLLSLKEFGHTIIIFTTRGCNEIHEWCEKYNMPHDYINHNPLLQGNNPGKPIADFYIDDRAVRFTNIAKLKLDLESFGISLERITNVADNQVVNSTKNV